MKNSYYEYLPKDYFGELYEKALHTLSRGNNVCISTLSGCGGRTFLNFFLKQKDTDTAFNKVYYYDPVINQDSLVEAVRKTREQKFEKKLFIIRNFAQIPDRIMTLEKLNSLRQPNPETLVFLVFADHTGVTEQDTYVGKTNTFFSLRLSINPFDLNKTGEMIEITAAFFGWQIEKEDYPAIFKLSGGVPRLIKHICKNIAEGGLDVKNISLLKQDPSIQFQLNYMTKLLLSFNKDQLYYLGILDKQYKIKSALLVEYFKEYQSQKLVHLFPELSTTERKILTFFYENQDKVISLDTIADLMQMSDDDFSLWAIYKLISRLKPKIQNHIQLINVKNQGYIVKDIDFQSLS
jgi:hypothetical protein